MTTKQRKHNGSARVPVEQQVPITHHGVPNLLHIRERKDVVCGVVSAQQHVPLSSLFEQTLTKFFGSPAGCPANDPEHLPRTT